MGTVRLAGENECPEGTLIGSQYGCNGHLQAYLRREVEDFEIVDQECVKPGFSNTLLIRASTVRLSRCRDVQAGLGCCAVLNACAGVQHVRGPGCARSRGGAVVYLSKQDLAVRDGVIRFEVCRPNGPECVGVRWSAPVREPPSRSTYN
jgi:hypothetical protein